MNKKAEGEISSPVGFLVGLVVGIGLIFFALPFTLKLLGIAFGGKVDDATAGSFQFLQQQIGILDEGQRRTVPYYLGKDYHLLSGIAECPANQLCLCRDAFCAKQALDPYTPVGRTFASVHIAGSINGKMRGKGNVIISRNRNVVTISEENLESLFNQDIRNVGGPEAR